MIIPISTSNSSFLEAILLSFVKQVSFGTSKIHNLWTPITLYNYIQIIGAPLINPPPPLHLHPSHRRCTPYSSMRLRPPVPRIWYTDPGRNHSCTRHRYEPRYMDERTSHTLRKDHRLENQENQNDK
jgi:hypothetical protein